MNIMLKRGIIIVFCCALSFVAKAQSQYNLAIGTVAPIIADTAEMYTKLGIDFWAVNAGENTIYETINVKISANPSTSSTSRVIYGISFPEGSGLEPGDSLHFYWDAENESGPYDDVLIQNSYDGGDNIIVVWPVVDGNVSQTVEQYYHGVHVTGNVAVVESPEKVDFKVLVSNEQFVEIKSEKTIISLSLVDLTGKEIYRGSNRKVSTENFSAGIYIVQVNFKDGLSQSRKVLVK